MLERTQPAGENRDSGEDGKEGNQCVVNGGERTVNEDGDESDGDGLAGDSQSGGDGSGRAFIDVGSPGVKGEEGELESDSAKKEEGGNPEQGIHRAFGDGLGDGVKAHAARKSIQVTESEQFKCRGDASHQNVFGAGFGALRIGLVPRGERIHRERGEFESQKEREQFVCGYDDEPSKGGGGDGGGRVVCEGPIEKIRACKESFTGRFI